MLALAALTAPAAAHAEEEAVAPRARMEDRGPNRLLMATGIATLGFSYSVSAYVGATSPRASEQWLVVPLLGPWVALARREECGESPAVTCDTEPTYKALLLADGAMQLAGVAQIAFAFVKRELRDTERPLVMPIAVRGGAGVGALATF